MGYSPGHQQKNIQPIFSIFLKRFQYLNKPRLPQQKKDSEQLHAVTNTVKYLLLNKAPRMWINNKTNKIHSGLFHMSTSCRHIRICIFITGAGVWKKLLNSVIRFCIPFFHQLQNPRVIAYLSNNGAIISMHSCHR